MYTVNLVISAGPNFCEFMIFGLFHGRGVGTGGDTGDMSPAVLRSPNLRLLPFYSTYGKGRSQFFFTAQPISIVYIHTQYGLDYCFNAHLVLLRP